MLHVSGDVQCYRSLERSTYCTRCNRTHYVDLPPLAQPAPRTYVQQGAGVKVYGWKQPIGPATVAFVGGCRFAFPVHVPRDEREKVLKRAAGAQAAARRQLKNAIPKLPLPSVAQATKNVAEHMASGRARRIA